MRNAARSAKTLYTTAPTKTKPIASPAPNLITLRSGTSKGPGGGGPPGADPPHAWNDVPHWEQKLAPTCRIAWHVGQRGSLVATGSDALVVTGLAYRVTQGRPGLADVPPEHIDAARHAAVRNGLISDSASPETADAWIAAWEAQAAQEGLERRSCWRAG